MSFSASSYSRLFLHINMHNHNRPTLSFFSLLFFSDTRPPYFGRVFRSSSCNYFALKALSPRRQLDRGIRRLFQIPAVFKYSYQSPLFPSVLPMLGCLSPLSYQTIDQRVDTNRGCIQRAHSLFFFSFTLPPSISPSFSFFSRAHPLVVNSCFLSIPLLTTRSGVQSATVVYTAKCALLAKRGKALPQRKAAVSGAASFYVLRLIVNTQPTPPVYLYLLLRIVRSQTSLSKCLCSNELAEYCSGRGESRLWLPSRPRKRIDDLIS